MAWILPAVNLGTSLWHRRPSPRSFLLLSLHRALVALGLIFAGIWLTSCGGTQIGAPFPDGSSGQSVDYTIQLRFVDDRLTPDEQALFRQVADRWATVIVGDLPDVLLTLLPGSCLSTSPGVNQLIDDLLVDISVSTVDGEGGLLGQAGPCLVRTGSNLPLYGSVQLDLDDRTGLAASNQLDEVFSHELGHVLGFGTTWADQGLVTQVFSPDPRFIGNLAIQEFSRLGGLGTVPIENRGGQGTRIDHWRESTFDNELMTGTINPRTENPLSRLTVASLSDLGYGVDLDAADAYALSSPKQSFQKGKSGLTPAWEKGLDQPIRVVDLQGTYLYTLSE
ncbi:MAG: hypothetical protein HC921_06390 [Synechococcaceae cyanobacterium SM2_3_1]|nr:hypothetical protein [Synechococcaceae cyanobacterium SM2_3_1]